MSIRNHVGVPARTGTWGSGRRSFRAGLLVAAFVAAAAQHPDADAAITFQVSFADPGGAYASFYDRIRSNVVSAGNEWAGLLGSGYSASLQVQVSFADLATASGVSFTNSYVGVRSGLSTYEQGAAYEIRTGRDPNGTAPDIQMIIGRNGYLQNELWFDPSPSRQTATVPVNRTDARSVFLHELGHAFVFNGWRDSTTGVLPGGYQSTFDSLVTASSGTGGPRLYFVGSSALSLYGGPVPLTSGNYGHLGNVAPGPGTTLVPGDLMNGVAFSRGTRYHVSPLDMAILNDTGFSLRSPTAFAAAAPVGAAPRFVSTIPEPPVHILLLGGMMAIAVARARGTRER